MDRATVHSLLVQLRDIIRDEREHAKALDIQAMMADIQRKEILTRALNGVTELHPDDQKVVQEIRHENRKNAYLFRATLNWIQESMEFFGRKTVPVTYSQSGLSQNNLINGRLLSGRI
ncbi:flagellar protein FlgN [Desulfobulbus sp.]|uniref:flagellar protein FlgN n=1 Tax=Desulfobulbus sp. TaxID=895 RepID=UPI00286F4EFD|nr:flagellar protein FlgN [Desulfobulbus sp.]